MNGNHQSVSDQDRRLHDANLENKYVTCSIRRDDDANKIQLSVHVSSSSSDKPIVASWVLTSQLLEKCFDLNFSSKSIISLSMLYNLSR